MRWGAGWAYSLVEAHLGLHGPPCGSKPGRLSTRSRCWTWPRAKKLGGFEKIGRRAYRKERLNRFRSFQVHTALCDTVPHSGQFVIQPFCLGFLQPQVVPNAPSRAGPVHQQELLSLPSRNSTLLPDSEPPRRAVKRFQSPVVGYATCGKTENAKVKLAHAAIGSSYVQ